MIQGYADLLITANEYAGRNDTAHLLPLFLGLTEEKFNRNLRVNQMETRASVPVVDGVGALPANFLEARDYGAAAPCRWQVVGNEIFAARGWTGDLAITYYAALPSLTPGNPTNWLLRDAPNAYLYGLVEEIGIWSKDADLAGIARQMKNEALNGVMLNDERKRWGRATVEAAGPTP